LHAPATDTAPSEPSGGCERDLFLRKGANGLKEKTRLDEDTSNRVSLSGESETGYGVSSPNEGHYGAQTITQSS